MTLALTGVALAGLGMLLYLRLRDLTRARMLADVGRRIAAGEEVRVPVGTGDPTGLADAIAALAVELRAERMSRAPAAPWEAALVAEAPVGLLVVDAGLRVQVMNATARAWLGTRGDPVGRLSIDSTPVPELQDALDAAAATDAPAERVATIGAREILVRAVPLAHRLGCAAVLFDATAARNVERARRDFVANVSHEIRTPATALLGFAQALADEESLPEGLAPMVDVILRNTRRLGALVEDVLQLSRIEARRGDLALAREPLAPLVAAVVERLAAAGEARGVTVSLEVPEDLEALVNPEAFEHALGNLVDNGIKYTPRGGRVLVRARPDGDGVRVDVEDDGVGIDPVHQPRIFERFYRVDPARTRDAGGTGLGLAIVKHLCNATSAEISFESERGRGSCFTLRFPA